MKRTWKEKLDRRRKIFIRWKHLLPTGGLKYAPGWVSNPATTLSHKPSRILGRRSKCRPPHTPQHIVPGPEMVLISRRSIFLQPAISVFWKSNLSWPFYIFCSSSRGGSWEVPVRDSRDTTAQVQSYCFAKLLPNCVGVSVRSTPDSTDWLTNW